MTEEDVYSNREVADDHYDRRDNLRFTLGLGVISVITAAVVVVGGKAAVENLKTPEFQERDSFTYSSEANETVCSTAIEIAERNSINPDTVLQDCLVEESQLREMNLTDGTIIAVELAEYPHSDKIDVKTLPLYSPEEDS